MPFISGYANITDKQIKLNGDLICSPVSSDLDDFLSKAYHALQPDYPRFYKMDRLSQLGFLASEILLTHHSIKHYVPSSIALVLSNAHSSLDTDVRYAEASKKSPSPALFVYTLPNIVAGEICIRHGIKGENAFFITQGFDADLISRYVNQVMMQNSVQACIAGWADVMGEHHDVFLYLAEKEKRGLGLEHTSKVIKLTRALCLGK